MVPQSVERGLGPSVQSGGGPERARWGRAGAERPGRGRGRARSSPRWPGPRHAGTAAWAEESRVRARLTGRQGWARSVWSVRVRTLTWLLRTPRKHCMVFSIGQRCGPVCVSYRSLWWPVDWAAGDMVAGGEAWGAAVRGDQKVRCTDADTARRGGGRPCRRWATLCAYFFKFRKLAV